MSSCVVDHILQEFNTLFLTRFRTYKIATPSQAKITSNETFRDWFLLSSFVYEYIHQVLTYEYISQLITAISFDINPIEAE